MEGQSEDGVHLPDKLKNSKRMIPTDKFMLSDQDKEEVCSVMDFFELIY
jgi:hypothetical protein